MGANNLQGAPWHIETLKKSDSDARRHRSRCKHFIKDINECNVKSCRCIGSRYCVEYEEKDKGDVQNHNVPTKKIKYSSAQNGSTAFNEEYKLKLEEETSKLVGETVENKKYGIGNIIASDKNVIHVQFKNGMKKFEYPSCFNNHYLEILNNEK